MRISLLYFLALLVPGMAISAPHTYPSTTGTLTIDYSTVATGKTLQTLSVNGSPIATHCYTNGERTPDSTPYAPT